MSSWDLSPTSTQWLHLAPKPAVPKTLTLGIARRTKHWDSDTCTNRCLDTYVHNNTFTINKRKKQSKGPSTDEQIIRLRSILRNEYYLAIKRDEAMMPVITRLSTGNTMLDVTPDSKGHILYNFYETSSLGKPVEIHSRPAFAKSHEGGVEWARG